MNKDNLKEIIQTAFTYPPEAYVHIYEHIPEFFRANPKLFAGLFFDKIATIDPKSVRLIVYRLYSEGITVKELYESRSTQALPQFLFSLQTFPQETLLVLLKYGFPPYPENNIFFWWSFIEGFQDEGWLDFTLDLCRHLSIDLNYINDENEATLLHAAIESGSLPQVTKLLRHYVDPNTPDRYGFTPLNYALDNLRSPDAQVNLPTYLEIIKMLRRYSAQIDMRSRQEINRYAKLNNGNMNTRIEAALRAGEAVPPEYCKLNSERFSLDEVEDLALIATVDPQVLSDKRFQEMIKGVNLSVMAEATQYVRNTCKLIPQELMVWPYYINDADKPGLLCSIPPDDRITAASPPSPEKVYEMAYSPLPDVPKNMFGERAQPWIATNKDQYTRTPALASNHVDWISFVAAPTPENENLDTSPLPIGPMLPTGTPELPEL